MSNINNINFTQWGTVTITPKQAVSDISNIFYNVFDAYPDLSPSNPTGAFVQELANMEVSVNNTMAYVTSNVYGINTSNGIFLDGIGNLFGIQRTSATNSTVACVLLGTPNLIITGNITTPILISDGTNQYAYDGNITLDTSGSATALFTCTKIGQINIPANSVTTIITTQLGWSSVTNPLAGIAGNNIQTDTSFRYVLKYSQAINGRGMVESLFAILSNFIAEDGSTTTDAYGINVPYIQGFYIYSNYTTTPQTIVPSYPAIPIGGVYITLYAPQYISPTSTSNLQYIAGIILNQIGANTTNNIQSTAGNFYNVNYINPDYPAIDPVVVNFDVPVATPITMSFSLHLYSQNIATNTLIQQIQQAILIQFYNGYTSGNTSYPPAQMNLPINTADYIASILSVAGGCTINTQNIQLVTGGTPATTLTLTVDKIATLSLSNIIITLV